MSDHATAIETLFGKAEDFGKTSMELFKLQAIDKSAEVLSVLATKFVITIVVASFILSINIGLALWIGELLGRVYYGFFIVAGFYALIAIVVHIFRKPWIKDPVSTTIIRKMMR